MSKRIELPETMDETTKRNLYPEVYKNGGRIIQERYYDEKYGICENIKVKYDSKGVQ